MDQFLIDARQAIRQLGARPGFSVAVLIILAVGGGANTAAFSIVRGMLLQPLPYPDSENIVAVGHAPPLNAEGFPYLLGSELLQLQAEARSFEQITGYVPSSAAVMTPDGTANLNGMEVTPSFFPLLRAAPHAGRLFNEADAVEGAQGVVLLSYSAWVTWFGADEGIVGAPVELNTDPHIVIGVLTEGFEFEDADFWAPLVVETGEYVDGIAREVSYSAIGRLQSGVSPGQATAEVRTILARTPRMRPPSLSLMTHVTPLQEQRGRPFHAALLMLTAATGLVLLMTCANVAGLLLARGMVRAPELGIRGAIGASRSRIVRQLLTECVVLGVIGGSAGLVLAVGIVRAASAVGSHVPRLADVGVDLPVLAFAAGLSVITGLLFGSAPAIAWSRVDLARIMNDAHAPTASVGRATNGQTLLVAGQVAIALVFLISAGLLLRSFVAHITFDPGFDPANIVRAFFSDASSDTGSNPGYTEALMTQMDRISSVPDVEAVALASPLPLNPAASTPIAVAGRPALNLEAGVRRVTPSYAETLRLRLLEGRFFTERDTEGSLPVAVVSESFAREAFGAEPAVGQQLIQPISPSLPGIGPIGGGSWEVIGVVADVSSPFLQTRPLFASVNDIYLSMRQPRMESVTSVLLQRFEQVCVLVRTLGDPATAIPFIREVLTEVAPSATVNVGMIETRLSNTAAQPRFYALCAGLFGLVALVLAAIGLYSLLSHAVSQRRREIGIRMALGADRRDVVMLVFRQGGILICVGVIIGLLAAAAATRILGSILFDVTPADPLTFTAVTALLLTVALIACWLPARQAVRIAPMDVLKGT